MRPDCEVPVDFVLSSSLLLHREGWSFGMPKKGRPVSIPSAPSRISLVARGRTSKPRAAVRFKNKRNGERKPGDKKN